MIFAYWSGRNMLSDEIHHSLGNAITTIRWGSSKDSFSKWYTDYGVPVYIHKDDIIIIDDNGKPFQNLSYLRK